MSDALGLVAFVGYCLVIVGLGAAITWVVVRFTPKKD